jgi:hypothetical protein
MSDKKVLNINPALFSVSNYNNKTKKKREINTPAQQIRVKSKEVTKNKERERTLKKRSLLKMIREQQQNNYDKMFEKNLTKNDSSGFESEFQKATSYLDNLVKIKNEISPTPNTHNSTIKNNSDLSKYYVDPPVIANDSNIPVTEKVNIQYPTEAEQITLRPIVSANTPSPTYGCLKNGSLPTYRNFMNKTIKNGGNSHSNIPLTLSETHTMKQAEESKEKIKQISIMSQQREMHSKLLPKNIKKYRKRRKTIRRTFKIGRSKTKPQISVLVSNKTIRNNITTHKQLLKQHSIPDIKKYLMKHGFIRVGCTTPNDVLRKMYETASLICGEIMNHNSDTLLYNFVNSKE